MSDVPKGFSVVPQQQASDIPTGFAVTTTPVMDPGPKGQLESPIAGTPDITEQLKTVGKYFLPIAGDILGTMIAPQFKVAKKAPWALRMGKGVVNLGARAVGSGAGSGVGEFLAGGDQQDVEGQVALGAGGEVGMSLLGGGVKTGAKVLKPLFNVFPDITFSGSAVKKFYNESFKKEATGRAQDFLWDIAPDVVKQQRHESEALKDISVMVNKAYSEVGSIYKLYKDHVRSAAETEGGRLFLDDTAQLIGDMIEQTKVALAKETGKGATTREAVKEALKQYNYPPNVRDALASVYLSEGGLVTPRTIEYLFASVFQSKGWAKLNPAQQEARETLKATLLGDLDRVVPAGAAMKGQADEEFKAISKFNAVRRIYDKALMVADQATGRQVLQPHALYKEIYAAEKRIKADPVLNQLWPALKAEADAAKATGEKISASHVDVGPGSMFSRGLGGAIGGFFGGPIGVPLAEGLGAASAWALISPAERKLLKKYFSPTAKAAGKTALRPVSELFKEERTK